MSFFDQFLQNYGLLGDWIGLKQLFSQMAYAKDDLVQFWAQTDHQKCLFTDLFFNKQGKKNHFCQNSPKMLPKRLFYSQTVHVFFWPYWVKYHGLFVLWCQRMPKIFITVAVRPFFSKKMVKKCRFLTNSCKITGYWVIGLG